MKIRTIVQGQVSESDLSKKTRSEIIKQLKLHKVEYSEKMITELMENEQYRGHSPIRVDIVQ
jgi:hypothetical protein